MPVLHHGAFKEPTLDTTIWRYLSIDKFKDLLKTSQLYLCRLDKFKGDPLDGEVPEVNYGPNARRRSIVASLEIVGVHANSVDVINRSGERFIPLTEYHGTNHEEAVRREKAQDLIVRKSMFSSCWHKNTEENPVFWKVYKNEPTVAIRTSVLNLRKSVYQNRDHLWLAEVEYFKHGESIPSNNGFHQATRKRIDFEWEKEIRLLYWCHGTTNREKAPSEDYKTRVDLKELISEIWMSPYGDEKQCYEVQELIQTSGLNLELKKSRLL